MNPNDFQSMSTDELWALHEEVAKRLAIALTAEKSLLESRLKLLQRGLEIRPVASAGKAPVTESSGRKPLATGSSGAKSRSAKSRSESLRSNSLRPKSSRAQSSRVRRPYPVVVPKYRNPERPSETWAGRGKTPRWLAAQLKSGRRIDEFRIRYPA